MFHQIWTWHEFMKFHGLLEYSRNIAVLLLYTVLIYYYLEQSLNLLVLLLGIMMMQNFQSSKILSLIFFQCSFQGVPTEERLHWRSFLVKLGADNLRRAKNEELFVASHKYVNHLLLYLWVLHCWLHFVNLYICLLYFVRYLLLCLDFLFT